MHFIWPQALTALVLMPVLVWLYVWMMRRRKVAIAYPSLLVVRQALGGSPRWRRHVPPALLGIAAAVAIIGVARPTMSIVLPADYMTLVLAMDVSRIMLAEDVEPNRIQAAQASVRDFLKQLPSDVRVGIVSFAATAQLVQPVTDNREDLVNAIARFELQRGTATGSGLLLALATLLPDSGINLEQIIYGEDFGRWGASPLRPKKESAPKAPDQKAVPPGSYSNGAIVLLSDGRRTHGPDVAEACEVFGDLGVVLLGRLFSRLIDCIDDFRWRVLRCQDAVVARARDLVAKFLEGRDFREGLEADFTESRERAQRAVADVCQRRGDRRGCHLDVAAQQGRNGGAAAFFRDVGPLHTGLVGEDLRQQVRNAHRARGGVVDL